MRMRRLIVVVIFVGLVAVAAQPAAKWFVASEVERTTASRLSMNGFRMNPLSGAFVAGPIELQPGVDRVSPTLAVARTSPAIVAERLWGQCDLRKILYRRLDAPVMLLDGVKIEMRSDDVAQVPQLEALTQGSLSIPTIDDGFSEKLIAEMERTFAQKQQMLGLQRAELEKLDRQVAELESQLTRVDNPLRGREAGESAKSRLVVVERTVADIESLLEKAAATCRREVEALQNMNGANSNAPDEIFIPTNDVSDFKKSSRMLLEKLLAAIVDDLRPSMALSVRLVEELGCVGKTPRDDSKRGIDFVFGEHNPSPLQCSNARMKGALLHNQRNFPFTVKLRNIGGQGLGDEDRPAFDLNLQLVDQYQSTSLHRAAYQVGLSPDRQGFSMNLQADAIGKTVFDVRDGSVSAKLSMNEPSLRASWLMHQKEWKLDLLLEAEQAKLSVDVTQTGTPVATQNMLTLDETGYDSKPRGTVIQAAVRGTVEKGRFKHEFINFMSPAESTMAAEFQRRHDGLVAKAKQEHQRLVSQKWKQALARQSMQWETTRTQTDQLVSRLRTRSQKCRLEVMALLEPSTDLRFSRGDSNTNTR